MINSQSMTLGQKQKFWKQHKEDRFKQMAGDRCALFNYFLNNNDILHKIEERDFLAYNLILLHNMDRQANIFFGSLVGVFLTDRFIINKVLPNFRFREWRLTANLLKFIVWPFCVFKIADHFILKQSREQMFKIQERYQFGFKDYLQANKIFERALAANRLEELLQKRAQFDWNQVPEIKDSQ